MKRAKRSQKIDTVEKLAVLMVEGFERVDKRFERVDERFDKVDERFESVEARLYNIEHDLVGVHRESARLADQVEQQAGYSKEIDYLLGRMSHIEKHLKLA